MIITYFGFIVLIVSFSVFFIPDAYVVSAALLLSVFGSGSVINLGAGSQALDGASILAAPFFSIFVLVKTISKKAHRERMLSIIMPGTAGFWLLLVVLYGLIDTFLIAPYFYGSIMVHPITHNEALASGAPPPLQSSGGNLTQSIFAIGEFLIFVSISLIVDVEKDVKQLNATLHVLALAYILSGIIDVVTFYSGSSGLIDWLRSANYALLQNGTFAGLKRINGFYSESSMYCIYMTGILGIIISFMLDKYKFISSFIYLCLTILILLLSTSTTAYLALIAVCVVLYVYGIKKMSSDLSLIILLTVIAIIVVIVALIVTIFFPGISETAIEIIDTMIFSKMGTASGVERGNWNADAINALTETFGLGLGLGGARTSSFAVSVLSNIGILGSLFYVIFLAILIFDSKKGSYSSEIEIFHNAVRCGIVGILIGAALSLASFDIGNIFYILAALAVLSKPQDSRLTLPITVPFQSRLDCTTRRSSLLGRKK